MSRQRGQLLEAALAEGHDVLRASALLAIGRTHATPPNLSRTVRLVSHFALAALLSGLRHHWVT